MDLGRVQSGLLFSDNSLELFGYNDDGQCTFPDLKGRAVKQLVLGGLHSGLLFSDSSLELFGDNKCGQCTLPDLKGRTVKQLVLGGLHSGLLFSDNSLEFFGANADGQCTLPDLKGRMVKQLVLGGIHSGLLFSDNSLELFGDNECGQCTLPDLKGRTVKQLVLGGIHSGLLFSDNSLELLGYSTNWQCTLPDLKGRTVKQLVLGSRHSGLLFSDNSLELFGDNAHGQCTLPDLKGRTVKEFSDNSLENSSLNFEGSYFYSKYDSSSVLMHSDVWDAVKTYLATFYVRKAFCETPAVAKKCAREFAQQLSHFVNNLTDEERAYDESAEVKLRRIISTPEGILARLWTSPLKCPVTGREWCSLVNEGSRDDDEALLSDEEGQLLQIIATTNQSIVTRKSAAAIPWPVHDDDEVLMEKWTLQRGGRLPEEHFHWYQEMASSKGQYRVNMFLPTSPKGLTAVNFTRNFSTPTWAKKVLYKFRIDRVLRCLHVNCLEHISTVKGEIEFLFPPYSAFRCTAAAEHVEYYEIEVNVMSDNRTIDQGGPIEPNLAIAPWA